MATKKREYEKPAMRVYELKQRSMLLSGSIQGQAGVEDYTITSEDDW